MTSIENVHIKKREANLCLLMEWTEGKLTRRKETQIGAGDE